MADDTNPAATDSLTVSFDSSKVKPTPTPDPVVEPAAPVTAKDRLRAFEDKQFGPDVVRVNGEIERGIGSPFQKMEHDKRGQYTALENLLKAEQKLADASLALAIAEANHEAAKAAVAAREADASAES